MNGATNSDNLVRRRDSTFTDILLPAAQAVGRKVAALPPVNGCVPGQLPQDVSDVSFPFPKYSLRDQQNDLSACTLAWEVERVRSSLPVQAYMTFSIE